MTVTVHIRNIRQRAIIGINPDEREKEQELLINAEYDYDAAEAVHNDCSAAAVNYKNIKIDLMEFVAGQKAMLLETLTVQAVRLILSNPAVTRAKVTIDKPHALRFADSVSVSAEQFAVSGRPDE